MRSRRLALALLFGLGAAGGAEAEVFLSQAEALALAFPGADRVESRTHVLDDAQAARVESLARAPVESRLATIHTGWRDGVALGHALIELHTVRTLPEAVLVVLTPGGEVRSLRMLAFYEPAEYLPPERWLAQFERQPLSDELRIQGKIHGIAGATLSSRAVTGGVRRALALWEVLVHDAPPVAAAAPAAAVATTGVGAPPAR